MKTFKMQIFKKIYLLRDTGENKTGVQERGFHKSKNMFCYINLFKRKSFLALMANLKYKDIKCVDVTKNEQICEWTETIYFVSDGGKIRTFIEHERRIEEINLNNHGHGYSSRERSVQV